MLKLLAKSLYSNEIEIVWTIFGAQVIIVNYAFVFANNPYCYCSIVTVRSIVQGSQFQTERQEICS